LSASQEIRIAVVVQRIARGCCLPGSQPGLSPNLHLVNRPPVRPDSASFFSSIVQAALDGSLAFDPALLAKFLFVFFVPSGFLMGTGFLSLQLLKRIKMQSFRRGITE